MAKRHGIVGSRDFPSRRAVQNFVASLSPDTIIVSGGAAGVDSWAVETARLRGMKTKVFEADWRRFGRKAGPLRNAQIVRAIDELAAFWDGESRGTLNTVALAASVDIPVTVFDREGAPLPLPQVLQTAHDCGVTAAIERVRRGQAKPR